MCLDLLCMFACVSFFFFFSLSFMPPPPTLTNSNKISFLLFHSGNIHFFFFVICKLMCASCHYLHVHTRIYILNCFGWLFCLIGLRSRSKILSEWMWHLEPCPSGSSQWPIDISHFSRHLQDQREIIHEYIHAVLK